MSEDNNIYTTDVVTTVRFTVRHRGKLDQEQFLNDAAVLGILDLSPMVGGEDLPTIESAQVISDEIEFANTLLEVDDE